MLCYLQQKFLCFTARKKKEGKEKSKYTFYYYRTVWDSLFFFFKFTHLLLTI